MFIYYNIFLHLLLLFLLVLLNEGNKWFLPCPP